MQKNFITLDKITHILNIFALFHQRTDIPMGNWPCYGAWS